MGRASAGVALDGFVHLLASQVVTRLFTFLLNLLTARALAPEAYGVAAVQFHLINTTILFLSREGFRRGCLRIESGEAGATRRVLALALLTVPIGAALSSGVTLLLLRTHSGGGAPGFRTALLMQGVAAFLEICSEPLYILASTQLRFGLRVGVETAAMVAKSAVALLLLRLSALPPAIAFSWAQLAYAAVVLLGYCGHYALALRATPRGGRRGAAAGGGLPIDRRALRLCGTFTLQAVEKLLLAEGSKMVVAAVQSAHDQGVYGLVANLGSLVVRTVFQPVEEAAFVAFSKEAADGGGGGSAGGDAAGKQAAEQEGRAASLARQWRLLALLTRVVGIVGLTAAAFGPGYSYLALLAVYSRRWADTAAPLALGLYSVYIALLAGNGMLEAYVHSVADEAQLHANNAALVVFAGLHLALSVAAVWAGGACGLIAADAVNMVLRIAYCVAFVARRFRGLAGFAPARLLPAPGTLAALGVAFAVTGAARVLLLPESSALLAWLAGRGLKPLAALAMGGAERLPLAARALAHAGVGVACLGGVAAVVLSRERDVLRELQHLRKGQKAA